ncbi:hypothetical protein AVEN_129432-1 [Araneus ventricosus]|uniref:Uncharacterized protein n=1 Tax=Araneus ventricosus TaxID=182803 RepID=A0A4Y2R4M6_ARAVE|nr:hypothetical protein AVEN_129432-1 [Araneus ventricosus]
MNKHSKDIRVFIVLEMAKCHENVKAVQLEWQEEFHNKNWPDTRSLLHSREINAKNIWFSDEAYFSLDGLTKALVKEGSHFETLFH